jgi:predicted flap endonuclease-1-like 5' DNA nuclease
MLDGVIVPVQQALFSILYFLSVIFWGLNQALLLVGYYILTITSWLSESMFQPLLESVGNATDSLLLPIFSLAMLTLAITYMLGVFGVFRVVEFRSAVMWMLVAIMWFQFGPEIYLGFEQTRRELGGAFFATTFTDLTSGSASIEGLGDVGDAGDLNINPPVNNFGAFLSFDTAIDGLDIALAYLNADGCDVLRTTGCITFLMPDGSDGALPTLWYTADDYFDLTQHGFLYPSLTNEQRQASLDDAAAGIWRALSGMVVSLFGMLEQIVQLLLTIAFGIGFASFFIAVLFAFFKKTESVTWAVFDVILGLFIQSIITSLLLALVMAFVSVAGATGNGILLLGVGFIGIILVTVLLLGAVSAILKALNGLMGSFGSVTGGSLASAGSVTQLASAYATGGATLLGGGSIAQAAGSALGPGVGQKAYYAAQTFGSDSTLGGIAQQVAQGSAASYLGPVGGYALGRSNRNTDDEADESASNKRTVSDLTLGTPIRSHDEGDYIDTPNLNQRETQGADRRVDPLTQQTYEFDSQDNGMGLRTYEDGSRLTTSADNEPQNQERARYEQQALRQQADDGNGGLNQDAINRIDASDDDESAVLNSSIARLSAMMGATNAASGAGADQSNDTIQGLASLTDLPTGDSETKKSASTDPTSVQATSTESLTADQLSTEMFLADVERAYPGSTGHPELVQKYFPENESTSATSEPVQPISTQSAIPATSDGASNRLANYADDGVQSIRSIGPATEEQLATLNITSAGQLATADPNQLATLEKITPARANQLVESAQAYVARPDPHGSTPATQSVSTTSQTMSPVSVASSQANLPSNSPNASQIASAVDASNNDDGARLATRMSAAITSASNTGRIPSSQQASQIARESGLPPIRESGQFVQIASAMNLSPQQAQAVVQDVQNTGQMNPEIATSVRSSLSALTLPTTGKPLDQSGMSSAINNLERAAQALVGAADSLNGAGTGNSNTEDQINAGAQSNPPPPANSSES